jgi:ABC-type amino acid transport substrate-binding protein
MARTHDRSGFSALAAWAISLVLLLVCARPAFAAPATSGELIVAVKHAPPFAYRDETGEWTGKSIELWRAIASELDLRFALHETTLDDMIAGVADGRYQAAVAALTVTSEREQIVDFTHPFYTTGLAIAVSSKHTPYWQGVIATVFSKEFLQLISALALIQLLVGTIVWLFERRSNAEQFPRKPTRGIPTGFWWATVTMTTVGYGDKAPKSPMGRTVALMWMLASVVIISSVTATIASSLTIERLDARIRGPEDLGRFEVGVIAQTTGASYLLEQKIVTHTFATSGEALEALSQGEIDALIWDAPLLRGAIADNPELDIELVPGVFQRQDYAIAVGEGSPLRESINRVLPDQLRALKMDSSL